ncbi:hypothetical protein ACP3VU_00440 [Vibrio sp. PNB23_22_6]|uniref:hypothetical protein n=1 Tax=unclassified Vibrio TaxID=2614977 RepID=UPI00406A27EF
MAIDVIRANPLTKMIDSFEKHKVKNMPTIRPELLGALMTRLLQNENIQDKTKLLILWQLHTICRPKEAVRTRWKDINVNINAGLYLPKR